MDLKAVSVEGMNCFNLCRQGQVAGCSEHANEPAVEGRELTNLGTVHFSESILLHGVR